MWCSSPAMAFAHFLFSCQNSQADSGVDQETGGRASEGLRPPGSVAGPGVGTAWPSRALPLRVPQGARAELSCGGDTRGTPEGRPHGASGPEQQLRAQGSHAAGSGREDIGGQEGTRPPAPLSQATPERG